MNNQEKIALINDFAEQSSQPGFDRAAWEVQNGLAKSELAAQESWNKGCLPSELVNAPQS